MHRYVYVYTPTKNHEGKKLPVNFEPHYHIYTHKKSPRHTLTRTHKQRENNC